MRSGLYLGKNNKDRSRVILPLASRQYHLHVLGQFGLGKSKFLEHLLRQDIQAGNGLCLIDPHGSLYDAVMRWCAHNQWFRRRKIVFFEPSIRDWLFGYNPLNFQGMDADDIAVAVDNLVKACAQVWGGEDMHRTPRLMRVLPSLFFALGDQDLTLAEAPDLLSPGNLRDVLTSRVRDSFVRAEWERLNALSPLEFTQQTESTLNRITAFLRNPMVRAMVGQSENTLDFSTWMDEGAVVLVSLGGLPPTTARLLGSLMVSDLYSRARLREPDTSRPFYLYVDECHQFFNEDVERIITELRKFGLWLVAAHQNLGQVEQYGGIGVYSALMQIPNKVVFGGLPKDDAEIMAGALYLAELEYEKAKPSMYRPVTVDHIVKTLRSHSQSSGYMSSHTDGSAWGSSSGSSHVVGADGDVLSRSYDSGLNRTTSSGSSSGFTDVYSEGESETMVPVIKWLRGDLFTIEEQVTQHMATLVGLPTRHAVVKLFQEPPRGIEVPLVSDPLVTDRYVDERKRELLQEAAHALPRARAELVVSERRQQLLAAAEEPLYPEPDDYSG